jgi:hypothetical protein
MVLDSVHTSVSVEPSFSPSSDREKLMGSCLLVSFPLSLVYRIFDIVFAEGIEAIFRFSLALMRRNEDKLLALDFEGILKFLGNEVFDCYKVREETGG